MNIWNNITPVQWFCNKVLPCVFDDTLSYYEVLCKFSAKLNEIIEVVNAEGEGITNYVNQLMKQFAEQWRAELKVEFDTFKETVTSQLNQQDSAIATLQQSVSMSIQKQDAKIAQLEAKIAQQLATIMAYVDSVNEDNKAWTLQQIEKAISSISPNWPPIWDPTDGQLEDIQTVINHLYEFSRNNALTAKEYDNLNLTAQEYDNYDLAAITYDQNAKIILQSGGN